MWVQAGRLHSVWLLKRRTRFLTSPGAGRLRSEVIMAFVYCCENSLPGSHTLNLCSCLEQTKLDFWHLFIRTPIPFRMMSPLWSNCLLKDSPLPISIPQNRIQHRNFGKNSRNSSSIEYIQFIYVTISLLFLQRETAN